MDINNPYTPAVRLNSICPYYTMFPLAFPYGHLRQAKKADWVLDPFCGRGTTNYAARLHGMPSIGIDSNPVAAAVAAAKMVAVTPEEITAEAAEILSHSRTPSDVPTGEFWEWAFHPSTLQELCRLREALIEECQSPVRIALRALMLGILHGPLRKTTPSYLSNQMPRTYATKPAAAVRFWKRRQHRCEYVDTLELIQRRACYTFAQLPPKTDGDVILGDSRILRIPPKGFRWVITSPPYFGMRFYRSDQWLRNWFLGGSDTVDYDTADQLGALDKATYVRELARVWSKVAEACEPGARLVIRFGVLPSLPADPVGLLLESLEASQSMWVVRSLSGAGRPPNGRRQADQFARPGAGPEEIDLVATLN